jgi:GT2 family glycosyltransferase
MNSSKLAVVVLHYKNWHDTISCVKSIIADISTQKDVYIIDNDEVKSQPATLQQLLSDNVFLIQNDKNYGFAGGYNRFLERVLLLETYDYFWFLNNDTQVVSGSIKALIEYSKNHINTAVIGSKIYKNTEDGQKIQGFGGLINRFTGRSKHVGENEIDTGQYDEGFAFDYVMGAAMFIPSWFFMKSGLFDETNFLYGEEIDIAYTCKQHSWEIGFCSQAKVVHEESSSVGNRSMIHDYYNVRNSLYVAKKNYPWFLPSIFISSLGFNLAPKLVRLQFGRVKVVFQAYIDFLFGKFGKNV